KNRGVFSIDLKRIERLVAARVPCGLERSQGAVLESSEERTRIVNAHLFNLSGQVMFSFLDEGLGHCVDLFNASLQPQRRIDPMGQQVPCYAAPRPLDIQPP